jgi:hypothetical protein
MKLLRWNNARPQAPQGKKAKPSASDRADRGWKSKKVSLLPVEGEIFFLTFPFIDQAIALKTPNERYRDITSTPVSELPPYCLPICGSGLGA